VNLTYEQEELLKKVVEVYDSGRKGQFILSQTHSGTFILWDNGPAIPINADKMDFSQLEREGLVVLGSAGDPLRGKPTQKGINVADGLVGASPSEGDRSTQPSTGPLIVPVPMALDKEAAHVKKPAAIFIGHGGSKEWLELEKFLTRDLHIPCQEFNAIPAAGRTTQAQIEYMLENATFAFIVCTGEVHHGDGTLHARENVIHEAGLFQGKLGISNAILLVEDGCSMPSNFAGLTHIRFPKQQISATFNEIRRTLEHRGIM
jgi:hypothetical protein